MTPKKQKMSHPSSRLRLLRKRHRLSQNEMADQMQVSVNTYRELEEFEQGLENEQKLRDRLLAERKKLPFKEDVHGKIMTPSYAAAIAHIFKMDIEELLNQLHLEPEEELEIDPDEIIDEGHQPSADHGGRYVPLAPQHAIHSHESLNLRTSKANDEAEQLSLGLLRLPPDMDIGSGSFAYVWTDEFENSRDALHMGELVFIDDSSPNSPLDEGAFYVIKDRGEVLLRRAAKNGKKWYLTSDHWNARQLSATERDSRVYGRVYRYSELMRQHLQKGGPQKSK